MRNDKPEIGDNVWHFLFRGGWINSFPDRNTISVEFYSKGDDPMRELEREEFTGCWTDRFGGCWYLDI